MFKDYCVIDNIFNNPNFIVKFSKELEYEKNLVCSNLIGLKVKPNFTELQENWRGFRSEQLSIKNYNFNKELFDVVFFKVFNCYNIKYKVKSFFHFTPDGVLFPEEWWHVDNSLFSGVVYLNKNNIQDGGTLLDTNNGLIDVKNIFNRLLFYKSNIRHRPKTSFGNDLNTARLTLTFFVYEVSFSL